jgi:hypothetical protein
MALETTSRPCMAKTKSLLGPIFSDKEFWLVIVLWTIHFFLLAAPYPLNEDSVNLALAIEDKIDITLFQPQPPGFLFQVLLGRVLHLFANDPFTVLELQGMLYLLIMLLFLRTATVRRPGDLLFCASTPLFLFFTGAPIMQSASVAFGAGIAYFIVKSMTPGQGKPVVLAVFTAIGTGFRYDLLMFLGPVVVLGIARSKPSIRQLSAAILLFLAITAAWYVSTSALSGWASPYQMTKQLQSLLTSPISTIRGGLFWENVRCAVRFLLHLPGVFGIGGIVAGILLFARKSGGYRTIALIGIAPFFLAGIVLYMPLPQYYAPIASFVIALVLFAGGLPSSRAVKALCVVANVLFFWLMFPPIPTTGPFCDRDLTSGIEKQLSYLGANSAAVLRNNNELLQTAEMTCGTCKNFYSPLPWERTWIYMAERRWHNHYVPSADSADCLFGLTGSADYSHRGIERRIHFERRRPPSR